MAYANYYAKPVPTPTPYGGQGSLTPYSQGTWYSPVYGPPGPTPDYKSGPGGAYPIAGGSIPNFQNAGPSTYASSTGLGTYPTSGGSVLGDTNTAPTNNEPTGPSPEELIIQQLESDYRAQEGRIGDFESGLSGQKSSMEKQAQDTWQQGFNTLNTGYKTSKGDLESYQTRTIQDIGEDLQNSFRQGAVMLGGRGAQDSSASGMMSYALGKAASKQRGDVMQDVSRRIGNLKSVYDSNMQNLELEKGKTIEQIGQWYNEALNSVRGMRLELQQEKSKEILGIAVQMLTDANAKITQRQGILDTWAYNKAQSLPQLKAMLQSNAQGMRPYQGLGAGMNFAGTPQSTGLFGFGNNGQDSLNFLQGLIPTK